MHVYWFSFLKASDWHNINNLSKKTKLKCSYNNIDFSNCFIFLVQVYGTGNFTLPLIHSLNLIHSHCLFSIINHIDIRNRQKNLNHNFFFRTQKIWIESARVLNTLNEINERTDQGSPIQFNFFFPFLWLID